MFSPRSGDRAFRQFDASVSGGGAEIGPKPTIAAGRRALEIRWFFLGRLFAQYGDGEISLNNVQGCTQIAADKINLNNIRLVNCAFVVPAD
jgi:hypothetical protein